MVLLLLLLLGAEEEPEPEARAEEAEDAAAMEGLVLPTAPAVLVVVAAAPVTVKLLPAGSKINWITLPGGDDDAVATVLSQHFENFAMGHHVRRDSGA